MSILSFAIFNHHFGEDLNSLLQPFADQSTLYICIFH